MKSRSVINRRLFAYTLFRVIAMKITAMFLSFCLMLCSAFGVSAKVATEGEIEDAMSEIAGYEEAAQIAAAAKNDVSLEIGAKSYILIDGLTGSVIAEKDADNKLPLASITKVMSLLLVMESISKGKLDFNTEVTASEHASSMGGSQIWLEEGETMTVDELLKAAVVASANDAMTALAEAVSGSEESFVAEMNARASELGMKNSHFVNCSGLDAEGHYSSARDIAIMSVELMKHEEIKNYSTIWMDSLRDGKTELVNTNKLVRFYSGATGLKTGTTSSAGCCLSATAERDGLGLVAVVMGAKNSTERFNSARKLLDFGFANYKVVTVAPSFDHAALPSVKKGIGKQLSVKSEPAKFLVKKTSEEPELSYDFPDAVTAPVNKGDKIGEVTVTLGGKEIGKIDITAAEKIEKADLLSVAAMLIFSLIGL